MTIIRCNKTKNYSVIRNEALRDPELTLEAKGMLAYILTLPDDWKIYLKELANHSTNSPAAHKKVMSELIKRGYVSRKRERNEKGQLRTMEYTVSEIRNDQLEESLHPKKPTLVKPTVGKTYAGETHPTKYLYRENTKKEESTNLLPPVSAKLEPPPKTKAAAVDFELTDYFISAIRKNLPTAHINAKKWPDTFRLLRTRDKRSEKQIRKAIDFVTTDSFWISNCLSPTSLRKHFDRFLLEINRGSRRHDFNSPSITAAEDKYNAYS